MTFFFLTLVFYFILDTSRRRVLNLTLLVCTFVLGVGSEVVQGFLPNDRTFDPYDIVANLVGSLSAAGVASWYHKRMLERRRKVRYGALAGEDVDDADLELGEGVGHERVDGEQENGVTSIAPAPKSVEEEIDNWDENAVDEEWDDDDAGVAGKGDSTGKLTPPSSTGDDHDIKLAKD